MKLLFYTQKIGQLFFGLVIMEMCKKQKKIKHLKEYGIIRGKKHKFGSGVICS